CGGGGGRKPKITAIYFCPIQRARMGETQRARFVLASSSKLSTYLLHRRMRATGHSGLSLNSSASPVDKSTANTRNSLRNIHWSAKCYSRQQNDDTKSRRF